MSILNDSARCKLFEDIASKVWKKIIKAHDVNANLPEIGITADILVKILQYNKGLTNFDVYAKNSWNESMYGSDIDVFVETYKNQYRWFALQAKILKSSNQYDKLRYASGGIFQWDKLTLLEAVSGCKSYYLLYNGRDGYVHNGNDSCDRNFTESQFGCSLVEPMDIKRIANKTKANGSFIKATFEDFHPKFAQPWRILTCCYHDTIGFELYSLEVIKNSNPSFKLITASISDKDIEEDNDDNETKEDVFMDNDNLISIASQNAKWNPGLRLVIHRTDNLEQ